MSSYIQATSSHLSQALLNGTELVFSDGLFSWQADGSFGPCEVKATIAQMRDLVPWAVQSCQWSNDQCQPVKDWLNGLIDGDQSWHELGEIIDRRENWDHSAGLLGEISVHVYEALVVLANDWTDTTDWPAVTYKAGDQVWVKVKAPITDRI